MKRIAVVRFPDNTNKFYDFTTDLDGLVRGDALVVETVNGLQIVTFTNYKGHSNHASKWVIQKIDLLSHVNRLKHEEEIARVKAAMDKKRKALEEKHIYQILAREDPEMAKLLRVYEQLNATDPTAPKEKQSIGFSHDQSNMF